MLTYRKKPRLRTRRYEAPEPPLLAASIVEPYSGAPAGNLVFDWGELSARAVSSGEATVASEVRIAGAREPLLVDATPAADTIFDSGAGIQGRVLTSIASRRPENDLLVFWPPDLAALRQTKFHGLLIPVIYPLTTDLELLSLVVEAAKGAQFVAAASIDLDPTAKRAVAESISLEGDDERYETLFHENLEPFTIATERHIAALATEAGLGDHLPVEWRSNWDAASMLSLAGDRLARMREIELGLTVLRSARAVAQTEKPLEVILRSASLSLIESLDEISAEALEEWLESGSAAFFRDIDERWRLRRDYVPANLDEE